MAKADLTRAQYSGYDFNTHLDDLRARIQVQYATTYNDFVASSLGMMLIESVAFGLDTLSFYLDRRASDTYLSTARTRKSVARLSRQLGYKMTGAVAASVDLTVTIANPGFDVNLPKGFQFQGPNNLIFENAQEVRWLATDTLRTKYVTCYEGETVTQTFTAAPNGAVNQVFNLRALEAGKYLAAGSVTVTVDGAPFVEKEFLEFEATDQFEVGYNDDPPTIRFGDGVAGNIPKPSASIEVTYVITSGKTGLVTSHTITAPKQALVVQSEPVAMTVDNLLGSVGGDDAETLDHAKIFAPQVYKSRYVAVTREDYEALAGAYADPLFGRVAVAQALSSRSAADDLDLVANITAIDAAVDEPLKVISGPVTLDGTVSVSSTGLVTGRLTKFEEQLAVGSLVKFSTDASNTLYQVTSIPDSLQCLVSPPPPSEIVAGALIVRYGYALSQLKSRIKAINDLLVDVDEAVNSVQQKNTDAYSALTPVVTALTTQSSNLVTAKNYCTEASSSLNTVQNDPYSGLNNLSSSLLQIGNADAAVLYIAKDEGVTVAHVGGSVGATLEVSVTPGTKQITVTLAAAGSKARDVAAAVNADTDAWALVAAMCYTGTDNAVASSFKSVPIYVNATTLEKLKDETANASGYVNKALTICTAADAALTSNATVVQNAQKTINESGTNSSPGYVADITTARNDIQGILGASATIDSYDTLNSTGTVVSDLVLIEDTMLANELIITTATENIYNHVDALLAADCKANLVTVPILARDKAGFFTAPSNGLVRSLQNYLDARKEVSQTVQVTSGAGALVGAELLVRIGVKSTYSESITRTAVESAIDGILRGRKFGADLYLSDFDVLKDIDGVAFVNVQITGPIAYLDSGAGNTVGQASNGNLIIPQSKVITKGKVTITTESVVIN